MIVNPATAQLHRQLGDRNPEKIAVTESRLNPLHMFMYASLCYGSDFSLGDVEVRKKTHEVEMREVRAAIEEAEKKGNFETTA